MTGESYVFEDAAPLDISGALVVIFKDFETFGRGNRCRIITEYVGLFLQIA